MEKILITGARSGIMNQVIEKIKNHYFIYLTVHTEKQLERVKEKYKNYPNIECFKLDVTNSKDRNKVKKLDIDILINNAAIGYGGSLIDIDIDKVKENYEVNVFSNLSLTQIILKNMLKKGHGKIINMASLAGIVPISFLGSYASTKASIIKLTETLNKELRMISDIKVSIIEPGFYNTGFNQVMFENKDINKYFKEQLEIINKKQSFIHEYIEKKNLDSIVNKIVCCIECDYPKFIYRAPFSQVIYAKIYNFLFS